MVPYEQIDHTADIGITARGRRLEDVFVNAAIGLFAVLTDVSAIRPTNVWPVEVAAADREGLLVRWLGELNFRSITRHELYIRFEIIKFSDTGLTAQVHGEPIDPRRHPIYTEIKAVTYHHLSIKKVDSYWEAVVIFDV